MSSSFSIESSSISSEEQTILRTVSNGPRSDSSRDSGTSSPQPNENSKLLNGISGTSINTRISANIRQNDAAGAFAKQTDYEDVDSDSNDSVFSTSSEDSIHEVRDIYLGGSCMLRTKWRRDIAIPFLKSKNISYYLPTLHENLTLRDARKPKRQSNTLEEIENAKEDESLMFNPKILDSSRVLLFVITNETRSLAPMTLAAHYIGLGYNVVLCIQMLSKECVIGNDKVRLANFYFSIFKFIFFNFLADSICY
jgi:raw